MAEELQKKLQKELDTLKSLQKDYQKTNGIRQQLDAQLSENKIVKEELELLKPSNSVYKLIGPVLIKQDIEEAKQNVTKRINYISSELERQEKTMTEQDKKMSKHVETLEKLQGQLTQMQVKSAIKT